MSNWSGFTEEDLQKVKKQVSTEDVRRSSGGSARGRSGPRKKPQRPMISSNNDRTYTADLPPEQKLSQLQRLQKPVESEGHKNQQKIPQKHKSQEMSKTEPARSSDSGGTAGTGTGVQAQSANIEKEGKIEGWESEMKEEVEDLMGEEEIVSLEMSNLDKFREQQKMIEELNKKKRHMLASAIQQRQKQAKAEAVKLSRIQSELEKMDQMLTVDVSLIRDRIEDASREYMEAQKRYDRAEKEFIASKMNLFKTQEEKEQLTEHLYTVIHQNEVRKAKKLKELMEKLEMENSGEDNEISELVRNMEMPSLTVLNSMQAKTITGPKSPPTNARISLQTVQTKSETQTVESKPETISSDTKREPQAVEAAKGDSTVNTTLQNGEDVKTTETETVSNNISAETVSDSNQSKQNKTKGSVESSETASPSVIKTELTQNDVKLEKNESNTVTEKTTS